MARQSHMERKIPRDRKASSVIQKRAKTHRPHPGSTLKGDANATTSTSIDTGSLAFSRGGMPLSTDSEIDDMDNCSSTQRQSFI